MRVIVPTILLCCACLMGVVSARAVDGVWVPLTVNPDVIDVDIFFSGGSILIEGDIPDGDEVVIEVIGTTVDEVFNIKGRFGPFWMTKEKVHLTDAPKLYSILLPNEPGWSEKAVALGLGVDEVKKLIHISGSDKSLDDLFKLFVRLKKSEQLYGEIPQAISYSPGKQNMRHFSAVYRFPPSTATGTYTIKATPISNGAKGSEVTHDVTVREVGFVKMVNDLASNQRLLYGVAAVLIALFAGGVMGVLFKGGRGH